MINMADSTREFLQENVPELLKMDNIGEILIELDGWIVVHGLGLDYDLNEIGICAQAAYDDLYAQNS